MDFAMLKRFKVMKTRNLANDVTTVIEKRYIQ